MKPLEQPLPPRARRAVISAFLLFHIVAITFWCIPLDTALIQAFRGAIRPYMLWSELFQAWDMFAPNPLGLNSYLDAVVKFRDGKSSTWSFPRMENLPIAERYSKERYRKFAEYVRLDKDSLLWPDCARYIARLNNNPTNPPVEVSLVRNWSDIPPEAPDGSYHPGLWFRYVFFHLPVQPTDLR